MDKTEDDQGIPRTGNLNKQMQIHNTWCTSICRYFYGAFRWTSSKLLTFDHKTRTVLRQTKSHHAGASLERLYLPRMEWGRGLQQLELSWEKVVVSDVIYLLRSPDQQCKVHSNCS